MMNKLQHITIKEVEYPLSFTLNVMEEIQEKYGTLDKWTKIFDTKKEVKMSDVIYTFKLFINEGIDIENEEKNETRAFVTHKQVGRLLTELGLSNATDKIKGIFTDTVNGKNE